MCFMCSVRCPIQVQVENGQVRWVQGNPHVPGMEGSLCPKGAAGTSFLYDEQRLQTPLIREGERGAGQWRQASWNEALDYVANRLKKVVEAYGGRGVALLERANLATHVSKTFLKAIGSPNHVTHDALCKGSVNTACRSLFGYTDADMGMQYDKTKHIVLYGRNIFEAVAVREVNNLMTALSNGARMTYIDPLVTVTATKAHRYWMIRPGTDLALNYALMHVILKEKLYDAAFVERWVEGLAELRDFVRPYTPEWAEGETGIRAAEIVALAREVSRDKPSVIFHFGYRGAHHVNEIYLRRSILILNVLMGSIETPGGLFFKKGPGAVERKPARKLTEQELPKVSEPRADQVGTAKLPLPDPAHGVPQSLIDAILTEKPYPLKALFINRFDALKSIPDTQRTKKAFEKLDLIVAIDVNFSDAAWYADVVLPESTFFERTDCVQQANGLKPQMFLRPQAIPPIHDTREYAMIMRQLAERMGIEQTGFVAYAKDPIFWNRLEGLKLKTPSGKIEVRSSLLEKAGFASFPPYEAVERPEGDRFRLVVGRVAAHTHVSTQNNPYLNELFPENLLWIHTKRAAALGIKDGQMVLVSSAQGQGKIKAFVTDLIHPEAVFMVHGFGHEARLAARTLNRGLSDSVLQACLTDPVGGSPALHETFVTVAPSQADEAPPAEKKHAAGARSKRRSA
ncbi:MAG: molybdopterin-dependent oxidoreductase [Desulfatitalea sp.]|nr:molybdopterin-dependent oxidoreductase [Desulfatitalea sp.]